MMEGFGGGLKWFLFIFVLCKLAKGTACRFYLIKRFVLLSCIGDIAKVDVLWLQPSRQNLSSTLGRNCTFSMSLFPGLKIQFIEWFLK